SCQSSGAFNTTVVRSASGAQHLVEQALAQTKVERGLDADFQVLRQPGKKNARDLHDSILGLFSTDQQHTARHLVEQVLCRTADKFVQAMRAHFAHDDDIDVMGVG